LPESSRNKASIPYGISLGSRMNSTPRALSSSYRIIDLSDERSRAELTGLWPIGTFPVLRDAAKDRTVAESTIIIEFLDRHYPGDRKLIPADPEIARETRFWDRFYDLHVHVPMQKIVTDKLRSAGKNDPHGVEQARALIETAFGMIERQMAGRQWALGDSFTMADCAAAPALYYANRVAPLGAARKSATAYLDRLMSRPSMQRVFEEAQPYFVNFPG
jgi:glutathione S-transferase